MMRQARHDTTAYRAQERNVRRPVSVTENDPGRRAPSSGFFLNTTPLASSCSDALYTSGTAMARWPKPSFSALPGWYLKSGCGGRGGDEGWGVRRGARLGSRAGGGWGLIYVTSEGKLAARLVLGAVVVRQLEHHARGAPQVGVRGVAPGRVRVLRACAIQRPVGQDTNTPQVPLLAATGGGAGGRAGRKGLHEIHAELPLGKVQSVHLSFVKGCGVSTLTGALVSVGAVTTKGVEALQRAPA